MAIFTRSAGTRSGPTLMGRVLPGPIRNRVGYGFFKKKPEAGPGFIKKIWDPTQNLARLKTRHLKLQKYHVYIFLYSNPNPSFLHSSAANTHTPSPSFLNLSPAIPHFSSVRHSLSLSSRN